MMRMTSLFTHPLTLVLFKFLKRRNLRDPYQSPSPGGNVKSGGASIERSDTTLSKEFLCLDDYFDTPDDQIGFVPCLDHDAIEISDLCPDEIALNVEIMSQISEDQQVLKFHCLGDIVSQIHISGPALPVATLLHRVLQTCRARFVSTTDE
jgi:hypothetical protein